MDLKQLIKLGWLAVAGFGVWLICKFFVKPSEQQIIDDVQRLGLSKDETYKCTQVHSIIETEKSLSRQILEFIGPFTPYYNLRDVGLMLAEIEHKDLFAKLYYQMYGVTLQSDIIDAFGEELYLLLVQHVPNFQDFC